MFPFVLIVSLTNSSQFFMHLDVIDHEFHHKIVKVAVDP